MVIGFLVLMAVSAVTGLLLRAAVPPALSRVLLGAGIVALASGFGLLGLAASGRNPWGLATGGFVPFLLISVAALVLPFAVVVNWGR